MRIHQLNCGTLRPAGGDIPCRVLLLESPGGLVLVDTGLGVADIADPVGRLGPLRYLTRPVLDESETALHRVEALGFSRGDVRHVVLTHMDNDHIGGLSDFPDADVHVTSETLTWTIRTPRFVEKRRFRRPQWDHGPRFVEHEHLGDRWEGFRTIPLDGVVEGMAFVDLPGHTRGHAGVLVPGDGGMDVLHAGDAFYHRGQIAPQVGVPPHVPVQERLFALEASSVPTTHRLLAELAARREDDLDVVCGHDPSGLIPASR